MKRKQESTTQQETFNKRAHILNVADDGKGSDSGGCEVGENPLAKIPRELVAVIFSFLDEGDEIILRATSMWLRNFIEALQETFNSNLFKPLTPTLLIDEAFELKGHTKPVHALALDTDKGVLYSGSQDGTIRVWDLESQVCITTLEGHTGAVYTLVLNTEQGVLYSGSADHTIRMWDLEQQTCIATLEGHTDDVSSLALDADKGVLYNGSDDNTISVRDLEHHTCITTLKVENWIYAIVLYGNRLLFSGGNDIKSVIIKPHVRFNDRQKAYFRFWGSEKQVSDIADFKNFMQYPG